MIGAFAGVVFAATALTGMARADVQVLGIAAPDCALTALGDGPGYALRQFRGKVVYVDFWASWCTTCVQSFPFLNDLDREFRYRHLGFRSGQTEEIRAQMAKLLAEPDPS